MGTTPSRPHSGIALQHNDHPSTPTLRYPRQSQPAPRLTRQSPTAYPSPGFRSSDRPLSRPAFLAHNRIFFGGTLCPPHTPPAKGSVCGGGSARLHPPPKKMLPRLSACCRQSSPPNGSKLCCQPVPRLAPRVGHSQARHPFGETGPPPPGAPVPRLAPTSDRAPARRPFGEAGPPPPGAPVPRVA
jgi:hypothetical protein